jgi:ribosomal protein S18 acetylase RimI-like enzyme
MEIRARGPEHHEAVAAFLQQNHSLRVARRGELVDSMDHPAFVALSGEELLGVATYLLGGDGCELLTLHATTRFGGAGTALLDALKEVAGQAGCGRIRVVTTNDNLDALRFYQRRGFRLADLRAGAVDECRRTLKPEIPLTGNHGIAIRDEIELELTLADD